MSSKIQTPTPLFFDIDGRPLDAGFIFIGESGKNPEVYPINTFWDESLSIPAPQPIRTRNGFFSGNGRFGKIYVENAKCSITIKNKKGTIVLTDLNSEIYFSNKAQSIIDESGLSQLEINNSTIKTVQSIEELLSIKIPKMEM